MRKLILLEGIFFGGFITLFMMEYITIQMLMILLVAAIIGLLTRDTDDHLVEDVPDTASTTANRPIEIASEPFPPQ